jgi:hypothetical protein
MPPPKKDEPGYAEYREQYALCDQSQLVDDSTDSVAGDQRGQGLIAFAFNPRMPCWHRTEPQLE